MTNKELLEHKLGQHMVDALNRYIEHGIEPGSFLYAVLSNDLKGAVGRADHNNQRLIFEYVAYLYNYCPADCWGSPEKVENWLKAFKEKFLEEQ